MLKNRYCKDHPNDCDIHDDLRFVVCNIHNLISIPHWARYESKVVDVISDIIIDQQMENNLYKAFVVDLKLFEPGNAHKLECLSETN